MKQHSKEVKIWRHKNPLKVKAHTIVNYALRHGKLKKLPCAKCDNLKVEAHHEDYTKPLEVIWLCRKCHVKEHYPNKVDKIKKLVLFKGKNRRSNSMYLKYFDIAMTLKNKGYTYGTISTEIGISKSQVFKILNNTTYN